MISDIEWKNVVLPTIPLIEIILRGSVMYLSLFLLLRVTLKRQGGTLGMTDLLLIVLLADASQNAMAGEYKSLPDGILLVATIIFWSYALDWLSFRFPRLQRLIEPAPLLLIKDGQLLHQNLRRELITEVDLKGQLRQQGISEISKVKEAYIETDGRISVIERDEKHHEQAGRKAAE
ncbi:MAG TPA: YetF domain-containing protein [Candidatus Udaeobacter sp.]|jgi:uncharacterized membrane protein YcaP (DUF421 family)|nr:YetF domain-containing protein [Candidatus Udaeobacter sp.]